MRVQGKLILGAAILIPLATGACSNSLRIATHAQLENIDPIQTTAYITRNHGYLVYDTLFALDQNLEPQPQMIESFSTSEDQRTWTFKLRPGLKWSDGSSVTAADCVASLQRWGKRDGTGQELFKDVAQLTASDDQTFVMQLRTPNSLVLDSLAKVSANVPFMMPKRVAETDPATPITDAVGSGPYMFEKDKWSPNKAVYVRNPYYVPRTDAASMAAGAKIAKMKEIDFVYYGDQKAAAAALERGDIDYMESPSTRLVPELLKKEHIVVASTDPLGNLAMMRFNSNQPPFNNPAVRRAVLMTINQADYMDAALGDKRFYRACYSVFPCGTPLSNEAGNAVLKTADLDAARRALKAAHYDGSPVVILNPKDIPVIAALTGVTAHNLRQIGMNVEVRDMTWAEMLRQRTAASGWSMFHTWWLAGDVMDPLSIAFSGSAATGWPGAPNDAELERYRAAYSQATDPAVKKQLAAKVQERILAIGALGTLGQFFEPVAFRDNITGLTSPIQFYWTLARETKQKQRLEGVPGEIKSQFANENVGY
ncbi:ABC transporter substrate-binding protein [Reyranella sp.]|jgi:peptide/nickel transport system substrate-binding protein|uniref:ABC transporter substrate-binding protein n=1 Tax=Reyranella sp. TaxID=1929291 RepID=UPI002F956871